MCGLARMCLLIAAVMILCIDAVIAASEYSAEIEPKLASERVVFQTTFGDIEMAFFREVAPVTVPHMLALMKLGCYNSNHFFRVDRGFVAQTADVVGGRLLPLSDLQRQEAVKHVPLEVVKDVRHHAGTLSMARSNDPNSGTSSFSVLLGNAPHLDMQYAIFGKVVSGMEALRKMEDVETTKSGIFVMPKERITIQSTFVYYVGAPGATIEAAKTPWSLSTCEDIDNDVTSLKLRVESLALELQKTREKCLPS